MIAPTRNLISASLCSEMISQAKISEIRDRASIVEVISDYVTLKRTGRNYMGLCPFHGEKTPSFTVSEDKGIFHCFGCHAGGSVFHFLMKYDQLSFPEAVERLAKRYGIMIERTDPAAKSGDRGERESLYGINEKAAAHYHHILFSEPAGKKAREYLQSRRVDEAVARRFTLGFAPQAGSGLLGLMQREKIPLKDALRLGLVGQRGDQHFHEKFSARLMFPIANPAGKIVGFGGRVLDQGFPKYLNSSETPLFRKRSTLYGLYQAKGAIRQADCVVVVEGYLDAIALHQFGISHVVATLGTALTPDHVRLLARYTKNVIALFDGDDAGRKAAARSFEIFIEGGLLGRAAFLPGGEDPDTFVHRHGREAVESILDRAIPLADYFFSWQEHQYGRSLEGKSRIADELRRLLTKVQNPFEVDLLVRRAVDALGIREELLRRSAAPTRSSRASMPPPVLSQSNAQNREDAAERSLISLMLRFPSVIRDVAKENEVRQWFDARWRPMVDLLVAEWQERGKVDAFRLTQKLSPDEAPQITALTLEGEKIPEAEYERMAADCLAHLRRRHLRGLERNLRIAIRAAEEQKDDKAKRERILEWQDVVRKERQLEHRRAEPKSTIR
jgi:DNA primase